VWEAPHHAFIAVCQRRPTSSAEALAGKRGDGYSLPLKTAATTIAE